MAGRTPVLGKRRRRVRRGAAIAVSAATAATVLAGCGGDDSGAMVLNYYGDASQLGMTDVMKRCSDASDGRYRIVGNLLPSDADGQREQLVRRLAAGDTGIDIVGPDVTWTAEFAEAGWLEPITGADAQAATEGLLQPPIDTATWNDTLYAIPKSTNVQLLWYRTDLVDEPPQTWDEMFDQAQDLKDDGKPYVIGFTGSQYEGLVVGFNTILASFGGTIVNDDSTEVTIDDKTVEALDLLQRFATSGLASRSLSNSQEPEVFAQFQTGEAAFILNWPYVQSAMTTAAETSDDAKEVLDNMAATTFPQATESEPARVTLGGRNIGVSTTSKHKSEAFEAAMCMASPESQKNQATAAGDVPVTEALFEDPEVRKAFPQYEDILELLQDASNRPKSPVYQNISTTISNVISPPSQIEPEQTAEQLKSQIQDALEGRGILP